MLLSDCIPDPFILNETGRVFVIGVKKLCPLLRIINLPPLRGIKEREVDTPCYVCVNKRKEHPVDIGERRLEYAGTAEHKEFFAGVPAFCQWFQDRLYGYCARTEYGLPVPARYYKVSAKLKRLAETLKYLMERVITHDHIVTQGKFSKALQVTLELPG